MRAVTMDFLGTLAHPRVSPSQLYTRLAQKYGLVVDQAQIAPHFEGTYKKMSKLAPCFGGRTMTSEQWWTEVVRGTLEGAAPHPLPTAGIEAVAADAIKIYSTPAAYVLYPETKMVLRNLQRRGLVLGVISNTDERVHGVISGLGLSPFLKFVLTSKECCSEKPQKEIFHRALELAGVAASLALHVGDDEVNDFEGARNAGMQALLVVRTADATELNATFERLRLVIPDMMPLHSEYDLSQALKQTN